MRLGYDRALLAKVAERLARAVMQDMRWSAKERRGLATVESLHAGVLMVVQRPPRPHPPGQALLFPC